MTFREWHKEHYGWDSDDAEYAKFRGEYRIRHNSWLAGIEEGRRQERERAIEIAKNSRCHCGERQLSIADAIRAEGK